MFNHPYKPYDVQKQFMTALYAALESPEVKVAIFESPTGTGKTLSLICPALAWLRASEQRELDSELAKLKDSKAPAWAVASARTLAIKHHNERGELLDKLMEEARKALKRVASHKNILEGPAQKRHRTDGTANNGDTSRSDESFLLAEPEDLEFEQLLNEYEQPQTDDIAALKPPVRIYFASRTHSQLTQLIDALRLLKVPASWSEKESEPVRAVPLGSRRHLCVNPEVTGLGSVNAMNERCAELGRKCSFRSNESQVTQLRNQVLAGGLVDIEELAELGRNTNSCPYYASREAMPYAEVVTLPYPLLVQQHTREALGLDLSGSVVIVDEAHNLMNTVSALHSAQCSMEDVDHALQGLQTYFDRVGKRLSASNQVRVRKLMVVISSLFEFFKTTKPGRPGMPVRVSSLFASDQADTVDLGEMVRFVHTTKLAFKVDSYLNHVDFGRKPGLLSQVLEFLVLASAPTSEGKLFWDAETTETGNKVVVKYLLLDPASAFKEVVDSAKCVVLAGGTMAPMEDYSTYLFPYLKPDEISTFSCGHIVPRSNLLVEMIPSRAGNEFHFTFAKRGDPQVIADLGETLLQICETVPAGVVAFFPGYKYLESVVSAWKRSGMWRKLDQVKRVFCDSPSSSSDNADSVFDRYSAHISSHKGALLLAVVGGRLSEGINFSNDLARGVVMVGVPFPNAFSAEMVAKRQHIESVAASSGRSVAEAKDAAREYYENLAMRAVNQSVGRAIRHAGDYAAIFLIDKRFETPSIQGKLSKWVRDSINSTPYSPHRTIDFFRRLRK